MRRVRQGPTSPPTPAGPNQPTHHRTPRDVRGPPGHQIGEDNIWLAGRHQERDALGRIMLTLRHTRLADGTVEAIRGAGVKARTEAITGKEDNS